MADTPDTTSRQCVNDLHCRGYDRLAGHPAWTDHTPLCDTCLTHAARDIRTLLYDWLDLEQLQYPTLSQALSSQPGGHPEPPMPLRGEPEALQREIHHVLTTWEIEVRAAARLADLPPPAQHGAAVQRAAAVLEPRMRLLALLPATTVYPTGCEDQPTDMTGADAIQHLTRLRARARGMLGWTRRTRWVPGDCWNCNAQDTDPQDGPLYRAEPRHFEDDCPVTCTRCGHTRDDTDYQTYLVTLEWPPLRVEVTA